MDQTQTPPPAPGPADTGGNLCAVLTLDAHGRILAANRSAQTLWQTGEGALTNRALGELFVFEVVSSSPEFLADQWEVLLAGALDREISLSVHSHAGAVRPVRLRIETATGDGNGTFLATVRTQDAGVAGSSDWDASLKLLSEQGSLGFFDLNLATGRVQFSPVWKKLLGYAPTELVDTLETWQQLVHPDDSAAAPDKIARKARPGRRTLNVEFRMRHQRGHWVWVQCLGVQLINATGALERVAGVQFDITERKEMEDTFATNDSRLQDLSGSGPLAAFELDFTNHLFWFSPAWETLLGFSRGELPPEVASLAMALPAEDAAHGIVPWLLSRAPGDSSFLEFVRLCAKDGKSVPVVLGAHRTVSRKRELVRVVGFACKLPAGAADGGILPPLLINSALNLLAEAVVVTDATAKVTFVNATAARMLQSDTAALRGQPLEDVLKFINRQSQRPGNDPIERAVTATQPLPLISEDALVPAAAGAKPIPVVWTARNVPGPEGRSQGVVIVFRNPEEMTLTPEELLKANRFEALGQLAGGIAHDINNLLATILGAVSLAKDNRDYRALGDAEAACDAARGLTRQLLACAKGGAGTQTICEPKVILDDSVTIAAASSNAEVTVQVPEGTHPIEVDRAQILQIFQNLIINALQAMPPAPHRPRLQLRATNAVLTENQVPPLAAGDYVAFEVRDNGSGIRPEHVHKIFDPFFTTKKHGTGLGLATVLAVARKHGGQVALETKLHVGTAFTVYLPKATRPIQMAARRAASLRFGTGRVLFMDDDPQLSHLTATMLDGLGYKHDLARNGTDTIALYKRYLNLGRPYDAVIMDITIIGGMGGEECFEELKKLDPDVRAIVATGYDNDEMERQFLERGFCGYLKKPYRVADLGKILKTVLG